MEFFKPGTKINFMGKTRQALLFSAILIFIGIISLLLHGGPNYGIDFAGGTLVQVRFSQQVSPGEIRESLKAVGLTGTVQRFGAEGIGEYLIRMQTTSSDLEGLSATIESALVERFEGKTVEIRRTEMVGPKVGKDLRKKGLQAIIFALIGILIYVSWRFEFRFAVGAVLALIHDVMITVGALSLTNIEFSLTVLAALLTIVGYSLNDTIVVYDRIRENMRGSMRREAFEKVVNHSINETLSRTILTGLTTLIVIIILFLIGGGVIHDFSFTLLVGVIIGTYSSIFVASPLVVMWEKKFPSKGEKRRK